MLLPLNIYKSFTKKSLSLPVGFTFQLLSKIIYKKESFALDFFANTW